MNEEHLTLLRTIRVLLVCVVLTFTLSGATVTSGLFYAGYQVKRFGDKAEVAGEKVERAGAVVQRLVEPFEIQPEQK